MRRPSTVSPAPPTAALPSSIARPAAAWVAPDILEVGIDSGVYAATSSGLFVSTRWRCILSLRPSGQQGLGTFPNGVYVGDDTVYVATPNRLVHWPLHPTSHAHANASAYGYADQNANAYADQRCDTCRESRPRPVQDDHCQLDIPSVSILRAVDGNHATWWWSDGGTNSRGVIQFQVEFGAVYTVGEVGPILGQQRLRHVLRNPNLEWRRMGDSEVRLGDRWRAAQSHPHACERLESAALCDPVGAVRG